MPRPLLGHGPERARRVVVLRAIGVGLAVALGAVAVWLIVTSTSQKRIEIGILAGLWGLLIGAYAAFGSRQHAVAEPPVATMPAFDPETLQPGGGVLDVRPRSEVQRKEEIAMRREFQARLEKVLRREVQEGLARELAGLRAEVAALRSELVEKVGGQLRLERIETTRLIGSDLEALQQQVRELKFLQATDDGETETVTTVRRSISSATVQPAEAVADFEDVEVEDVEDEAPDAAPEPEPVALVKPEPVAAPVAQTAPEAVAQPVSEPVAETAPEPVAETVPEPVAEPVPEPQPAPEPELGPVGAAAADDPFAALPRLTPFTDFEPIADPAPPAAAQEASRGGRRHREDDSEDNVLARILQRERTRSQ
jgi:hypothetical protein